jgi:hypothetical protein
VQGYGKGYWLLLGIAFAGLCGLLGFIFAPLWIGCFVGVALALIAPFARPTLQCEDCKNAWSPRTAGYGRT